MTNHMRLVLKGIPLMLAAVFIAPASILGQGKSGTHTVTCGPDKTIGQAIQTLKPGDTLLVSGDCNENLVLGQEVERITIDGQGTASIHGDSTASTITISGRGITIKGLHVTGGNPHGIGVFDGGSAVIDGNTIEFAGRNGVAVFRNSSADILNNVIQNNPVAGIAVQSTSSVRVGWFGPPNNRTRAPNTIQNNGAQGIQVYRGSSAQIYSNIIQNNVGHGVIVDRNAQAEIGANTIAGNGGDGILGMRGAAIDIGTDATGATPAFDDDTNTGTNAGFGLRCLIGGFVDGRFGTLTGTLGAKSFSEACTDSSVQ